MTKQEYAEYFCDTVIRIFANLKRYPKFDDDRRRQMQKALLRLNGDDAQHSFGIDIRLYPHIFAMFWVQRDMELGWMPYDNAMGFLKKIKKKYSNDRKLGQKFENLFAQIEG